MHASAVEGQSAFATEGVVDGPEEGPVGERIVTTNLATHGECVDVPGGVAEEAMELLPVKVSDVATGEDDFGNVAVELRDDPESKDQHECLVGRGREN